MKCHTTPAESYLSLLKKSLLNELYLENDARIAWLAMNVLSKRFLPADQTVKEFLQINASQLYLMMKEARMTGHRLGEAASDTDRSMFEIPGIQNFVHTFHTMIGRARLDNLHQCLDAILKDNVSGDFIETGVWKGGATIFMRGFLAAYDIKSRQVWVADSFEGLPKSTHKEDQNVDMSKEVRPYLSVGIEEVQELFSRYDLLDEQVQFLKGWFADTLPTAPIQQLSLLRLDGDLYQSTIDALENLYFKLSNGGFVIVDNYASYPQCKAAVDDFRNRHGITDDVISIDSSAVYWRRSNSEIAAH